MAKVTITLEDKEDGVVVFNIQHDQENLDVEATNAIVVGFMLAQEFNTGELARRASAFEASVMQGDVHGEK